MIGDSAPMKALAGSIRKVAPHKATVLVQGESGTGKELIARAVHDQSPRAGGPFVAVNCGAIPAGLMESELFGHTKGAFTDALRDRIGLLEQSSGGTLFLDEVGELPAELQVKLLRALQEERVRRLGDADDRPIDLRLVAATARDLEAEIAAGRFREDLYHRINVVALRVPPLRDRTGDIPLLAAHFVTRVNQRSRLAITGLSREAMRLLHAYAWPGNVRELENTIERAAVMCEGPEIDAASLPDRILNGRNGFGPTAAPGPTPAGPGEAFADLSIKRASRRVEEELIRQALARTGGNRTHAAELLDISHRALLYKIKEYGVSLPMTTGGPSGPPKDGKD
jgi:two-component system response regulator AtoC